MFGKCPTSAPALWILQERDAHTCEEQRPKKLIFHGHILPQPRVLPPTVVTPNNDCIESLAIKFRVNCRTANIRGFITGD